MVVVCISHGDFVFEADMANSSFVWNSGDVKDAKTYIIIVGALGGLFALIALIVFFLLGFAPFLPSDWSTWTFGFVLYSLHPLGIFLSFWTYNSRDRFIPAISGFIRWLILGIDILIIIALSHTLWSCEIQMINHPQCTQEPQLTYTYVLWVSSIIIAFMDLITVWVHTVLIARISWAIGRESERETKRR